MAAPAYAEKLQLLIKKGSGGTGSWCRLDGSINYNKLKPDVALDPHMRPTEGVSSSQAKAPHSTRRLLVSLGVHAPVCTGVQFKCFWSHYLVMNVSYYKMQISSESKQKPDPNNVVRL